MQSNFAPAQRPPGTTANPAVEETYGLAGLNLRDPDEIMPDGESPWTINSRMYARNDGESRVANRTRMGAGYLSIPIGETLDTENVGSVTFGDIAFGGLANGTIRTLAQQFTATSNGAITRADVELRKNNGSTGHVLVEIRTDASNLPSTTILAQGSILGNLLTTSQAFYTAYFIDAPTLAAGTKYWIVVYQQDNGTNSYYGNLTNGSGCYSTITGTSWTSQTGEMRFKTYISTTGLVRGYHLRYPSDVTTNKIMIAHRDKIWAIPKATGVAAQIDSGLTDANSPVRFAQFDDKTIWVNGVDHARWWDGTTVSDIGPGVPSTSPSNVIIWQNRMFIMSANTRVDFSNLSDPTTFNAVNFFYVPTPLSSDHMTGWKVFQNNLVIFTHNTKYITIGSDISTFTRKQAVGTKGAVSQEAMDADRNFIYFMADDKQVYAFNGVADTLLSEKIQPELTGISDVTKVRIHVYRNQVRIYYAKTPSTTNNRMALYDLELKQWFLDTDHPIVGSAELYQDEDELVEFSALVGQVDYGEMQFSDLGKALDYKFWTRYKTYAYRRRNGQTFGGALSKKRIKRFRPIVRTVSAAFNMQVGKDMEFQDSPDMRDYLIDAGGAKWGAFDWGDGTVWGPGARQIQNRAGMSGRGGYIQYRFERKGVETPVELYGYAAMYKLGRQK